MKVDPFIEAEKAAGHGAARTCRLLEVFRAAYYQRRSGAPSPRAAAAITAKIASIHSESEGTYGSPRVHQLLRRQDVSCGKRRAARLMRAAGLEGRRKKRWRATTIADPAAEAARDLIQRDVAPRPGTDQRYAGDITYVMTWQGWAYLATVIDLSSRRVVGWALADHMRTSLVQDALSMAFTQRRPAPGLIFHSDRGCPVHQPLLRCAGQGKRCDPVRLTQGECWGNAVAESFFATIKRELTNDRAWPTRAGLQRAVFDYIEGWYNIRRLHSALGYLSPAEYESIHHSAAP